MAPLRRIIPFLAFFAALFMAVIIVNQTLQLAEFGARIHPRLGDALFWGILWALAISLAVPVLLILRLPKPLVPPELDQGPEFDAHLLKLGKRLGTNPRLSAIPLGSREEMEVALAILDAEATGIVKQAGSRAFVITAVSQNGALDALIVLGIHARLVWDVARVYRQRPGLREMVTLYTNVLATALIAAELDDADLAEALQPALAAASGSVVGVIPGLGSIGTLAGNSILSGTGNAFLTLRVGIIAREQSRAWVRLPRRTLRRMAVVQAGAMLAGITREGGRKVASVITLRTWEGTKGAFTGAGRAVAATPGVMGRGVASASGAAMDALLEGTERASKPLRRAMDWMTGREGGGGKGGGGATPGGEEGAGGEAGPGPGGERREGEEKE